MKNKYIKLLLIGLFLSLVGCSLDEVYYSSVTPEKFFESQQSVLQRLDRPFTHTRWYIGDQADIWQMQEYAADAFCLSTKGPHWYNGGVFQRIHHHEWTPDDNQLWNCWYGATMGVALALEAKEDLDKYVNYDALGFPKGTKEAHQMQLQTLIAYFYLRGLDFFGGMPIYTATGGEDQPRSTDVQTFEHIEKLLKEAIPALPKKTELGKSEEGAINQATAAIMLAQLYFNAESYVNKAMFSECEKICQDIVDGVYGAYKLDETWNGPHCFTNERSPEVIWNIPCQNQKLTVYGFMVSDGLHYNASKYFDLDFGANNGFHLQPSLKPTGGMYTEFKLGKPFSKFADQDLRKKPYLYLGNEKYEGMFCFGDQINPKTKQECLGSQEYNGKLITFVDQVARFSEVGTGKKYSSIDQLPSTIADGEENSGVRFVKYPLPNMGERNLRNNPDLPIYRLAEVYYILAECKLRAGNTSDAAKLINEVRKRNFEDGIDPNPVTANNLDKYRMLDEWLIEFLGEQRRRTDLIRWNAFVTEDWWDHKATNDKNYNRYPVPSKAMSSSNLLIQNPGY